MISRIAAVDPERASDEVRRLLATSQLVFGVTPNMARVMASSPAVLRGYLQFVTALAEGHLSARLREQIALAVAEANTSQYCLSAHTAIGADVGLDEAELSSARLAMGPDPKSDAALRFARATVDRRGELTDEDFLAARRAGFSDEEIVEILANVCVNILTNYLNKAVQTEIDFPIAGMAITPPGRRFWGRRERRDST